MKNFLLLPDLIAIACMALVLIRLRGKRAPDGLHLWITGMLLIVAECVTRVLYLMPLSKGLHTAMHVLSLEFFLVAGVAFLQSATGRLRFLKHSDAYLVILVAPHAVLLFLYGSGFINHTNALAVAVGGLSASIATAAALRRPAVHYACHFTIWLPILVAADADSFRTCAYLSLFFAYACTALSFALTMPRHRRGRAAVVGAFFLWSLCFLTHPWLAERHKEWLPLAEQIWNLQKFFVTFGLLIAALDEQMITNEHHALHDPLTGLPNRRFFEDHVPVVIRRAGQVHQRLLLFNMDMNGFKQVNDVLGHDAGDQLLCKVGERLQAAVRGHDTLARMGGDEFNLLIEATQSNRNGDPADMDYNERAKCIAAALRDAVSGTPCALEVDGHVHRVRASISIGWAIFPDDATNRDDLQSIADKKMYAHKRALSEHRDGKAVEATTDLWQPENSAEPADTRLQGREPESSAPLLAAAPQVEEEFGVLPGETACQVA